MTAARLELTREQVLAYRRAVNGLDARTPSSPTSLRRAAWAGLQDSMPRAAVVSLHARVDDAGPAAWEDPALVQVWGPRFSAYVVAARDVAIFSLGRLPADAKGRRTAEDLAERLDAFLEGRRMTYGAAGAGLGVPANRLRYAATTGRVLIRWDGARQPTIWTMPRPDVEPDAARLGLAGRYLEIFGPGSIPGFAKWAGVGLADGRAAFDALAGSLTPTRTSAGDGWILTRDEPRFRTPGPPATSARLLPSGDAYYLFWGADRELLVPAVGHRGELWTSRVWPGAVLSGGEIVGTWRRAGGEVVIATWRPLTSSERESVEAEASALPLLDIPRVRVRWDG